MSWIATCEMKEGKPHQRTGHIDDFPKIANASVVADFLRRAKDGDTLSITVAAWKWCSRCQKRGKDCKCAAMERVQKVVQGVVKELMSRESVNIEGFEFQGEEDLSGTWAWSNNEKELRLMATPFWDSEEGIPFQLDDFEGNSVHYGSSEMDPMDFDLAAYLCAVRDYIHNCTTEGVF